LLGDKDDLFLPGEGERLRFLLGGGEREEFDLDLEPDLLCDRRLGEYLGDLLGERDLNLRGERDRLGGPLPYPRPLPPRPRNGGLPLRGGDLYRPGRGAGLLGGIVNCTSILVPSTCPPFMYSTAFRASSLLTNSI